MQRVDSAFRLQGEGYVALMMLTGEWKENGVKSLNPTPNPSQS